MSSLTSDAMVPEIDRVSPTRRPNLRNDGTQSWHSLLFLHWQVPAATVSALLPPDIVLDTYEGSAFVGLVPFLMRNIRPSWLPRQCAFNFLETNVRTYVIHKGRPGVYFFSLDANSLPAVMAARHGWSLPYVYSRMRAFQTADQTTYQCRRIFGEGASFVKFRTGSRLGNALPNTLEYFLFERYLLFVEHRQRIYCGQVHHTPYEIYYADVEACEDTLVSSAGFGKLSSTADLAHYSPGVDVEVFGIRPN